MKKIIKEEITSQDERFFYCIAYYDDDTSVNYLQITDTYHKEKFWFLYPPKDIFEQMGFDITSIPDKKLLDIQNYFQDCWVSVNEVTGLYYLSYFSLGRDLNTIINWVLGPISETLAECDIPAEHISWLYPLNKVTSFYDSIYLDSKFIKSKTKEALKDLSIYSIKEIQNNQNYFMTDSINYHEIIDEILKNNKEKIIKNPQKIFNWIVGQVMKETKGKADPIITKEKINEKLKEYE